MSSKKRSEITKEVKELQAEGEKASQKAGELARLAQMTEQTFASLHGEVTTEADQSINQVQQATSHQVEKAHHSQVVQIEQIYDVMDEKHEDFKDAIEKNEVDIQQLKTLEDTAKLSDTNISDLKKAENAKEEEVLFLEGVDQNIEKSQDELRRYLKKSKERRKKNQERYTNLELDLSKEETQKSEPEQNFTERKPDFNSKSNDDLAIFLQASNLNKNEVYQLLAIPNVSISQLENLYQRADNDIDLLREELSGGHSIAHHGTQLTCVDLEQRTLGTHPYLSSATTAMKFIDDATQRDAINQAYKTYKSEIDEHFSSGGGRRVWEFDYGKATGIGFCNMSTPESPSMQEIFVGDTTRIKIIFKPDPNNPGGYILLTAFPMYP